MRPLQSILKSSLTENSEQTGEALDMKDVKEALPKVSFPLCTLEE